MEIKKFSNSDKRIIKQRKGLSNVVTSALLISIGIALVAIVGTVIYSVQQGALMSPEFTCRDFSMDPSLSIENACYLNEGENKEDNGRKIKVRVSRSIDDVSLSALRFGFSPGTSGESSGDNAVYEITGNKCSDVKISGGKFGEYCSLPDSGGVKKYIFDLKGNDPRFGRVSLGVYLSDSINNVCSVGSFEIRGRC